MLRRSHPAHACARRAGSANPSTSTTFSMRFARSMTAHAIHQAANQCGCARPSGVLPREARTMQTSLESSMLLDVRLARLRAHRNNIHRYRRLLGTRLTELERGFLLRRLQEEEAAMNALNDETFPFTLPLTRRGDQIAA